ncbi:MAG: signal peptidase II [Christensenellales bacterium]|jgi:signal peptidase II
MLTDLVLTLALLAVDQLTKYWAVHVLAGMPGGMMPVIGGVFHFVYAENTGENVSFLRGRSAIMLVVRLLQVGLAVYLLVRHRKKLARITRIALCFFLAGLVGNQLNYMLFDFVPDMIYLPFLGEVIFNVADIWALVAMVVLFVRLGFYEGRDFVDWLSKKLSKKQQANANTAADAGDQSPPIDADGALGEDHVPRT